MHLLQLLKADSRDDHRSVVFVTVLAGLGNAALIGLINKVAEDAAQGREVGTRMVLLYLCVFAFFYIANRASLKEANRSLQQRLGAIRQRIVDKIRKAPLRSLERIGHGDLYAVVAQETDHLSQKLPIFVSAGQSLFLLAFSLLYIATLSLPSFLVIAAFTAVGLFVFWRGRVALNRQLAAVHGYEAAMLDSMASFTEGFQEIRLNADRNDSLFRHYSVVVDDLETAVLSVGGRWVSLLQFANAFLYALVGVVIFVLPIFFQGYDDTIYKIAAASIFCVGPVTAITAASHLYAQAEIGLAHVHNLEEMLDREAIRHRPTVAESRFRNFTSIDFEAITFSYRGPDGQVLFTLGPLDLHLSRGEILFLTGGNGSGKSTAMKLLCGLYRPDGGRILVDGETVTDETLQEFRECFTAIFPDFHLFDRLHGLGEIEPERVHALIDRMELGEKVSFADGAFSTLELSTGQRKRLAMIAGLLEDRPIYLFDEWAADQDSHFREVFYTEILPDLKARGKSIVAVTHDDRYWSCCDRRATLDLGEIVATREEGGE